MDIASRLKKILEDRKISVYRLKEDLKVNDGTVRGWLKGSIPRGDHLIQLSDYFKVSPRYLMSLEDEFPAEKSKQELGSELYGTDIKMARTVDDIIEALLRKQIISITDLSPHTQELYSRRKILRDRLRQT